MLVCLLPLSLQPGLVQLKAFRTASCISCSQPFQIRWKKKITEIFLKVCKSLSIHSHSRGLDGLWQAVSLLSGYPKQQSDHLPLAVWIHFREKFSSASAAPEWKTPESDVMFRPSAAALQRRAGKGRRRGGQPVPSPATGGG